MDNLITIKDDFFSEEDLQLCVDYVSKYSKNYINVNEKLTEYIWNKYKENFKQINPKWISLYPEITVSNSKKPIKLHKDRDINDAGHKILVYLNTVENGGTFFYVDGKEYLVENKINRLVSFDISLYHKGQGATKENKLAIGFRPRTK